MGLFDGLSIPLITTAPLNAAVYSDAISTTTNVYGGVGNVPYGPPAPGSSTGPLYGPFLPSDNVTSSGRAPAASSPLINLPSNIVPGGDSSSLIGIGIIALCGIALIAILK